MEPRRVPLLVPPRLPTLIHTIIQDVQVMIPSRYERLQRLDEGLGKIHSPILFRGTFEGDLRVTHVWRGFEATRIESLP